MKSPGLAAWAAFPVTPWLCWLLAEMDIRGWSPELLTEFIGAVSAAGTDAAAARAAVEHAAAALGAEVAAILGCDGVVAAVGYPEGSAPVSELAAVRPGVEDASLQVPGIGCCAAVAAGVEYPPGARLVLARAGPDAWSRAQAGLLRGMARVTADDDADAARMPGGRAHRA